MATILPEAKTQFTDALGVPLAGGSVYFYTPNTTTPKDTYQDANQVVTNSNPVILDSAGRAIIFGSGAYRQVVYDALGNLIWDQTTSESVVGQTSFGGTSTGSANAQVVSAGTFSGADGSVINFTAGFTNTGAMTVAVGSGGSPIAVLKNGPTGPVNLVAGDIAAGNIYSIAYSVSLGTFQLLQSIPPVITIASQAQAEAGTDNTTIMTPLRANQAIQALGTPAPSVKPASWPLRYNVAGNFPEYVHPLVAGNFSGLVVTVTSATTVSVTASLGLSVSANITVSGAGGLDTGTESGSTWYYVWVIWNGATAAALLSLSSTSPTMPEGYVNKVRVGAVRNDASGNFWRTVQKKGRAQIVVGTNPVKTSIMATGPAGNVSTPTYASVSISSFAPPTASEIYLTAFKGDDNYFLVAPNANYGAFNDSSNPPYVSGFRVDGNTDFQALNLSMLLESTSIYWASTGASTLAANGWVDNI